MAERKYLVREGLFQQLASWAGWFYSYAASKRERERITEHLEEVNAILAQPPASDEPSGDELHRFAVERLIEIQPMLGGKWGVDWSPKYGLCHVKADDPKSALLKAYRKSKENDSDD